MGKSATPLSAYQCRSELGDVHQQPAEGAWLCCWWALVQPRASLGRSCHPLPTLSRERSRGAGLSRELHPEKQDAVLLHAHAAVPTNPATALPGRSYSDVKTKPSAPTGAGLAAQRDEWNETQLWIMCLLMNLSPKVHTLIYAALKKILIFVFKLFISMHKCLICLSW